MQNTQPRRKRFSKPWHFLSRAGRPRKMLWEIFDHYHLDSLKEEIQSWKQLALCNDNSAYDEGGVREDLMDFTQALLRVMEAFHIINERKTSDRRRKQLKGMSKESLKIIAQMNIPVLLTADEKKKPQRVIHHFCKTFRRSYVQMELMDMLDAVITYKGERKLYKGNRVLFYEALSMLTNLAYKMYGHGKRSKSFVS